MRDFHPTDLTALSTLAVGPSLPALAGVASTGVKVLLLLGFLAALVGVLVVLVRHFLTLPTGDQAGREREEQDRRSASADKASARRRAA